MTINVLKISILIFMISSCKTKKSVTTSIQASEGKESVEKVGHLKMGLLEYEIIDSTLVSEEVAEMMIGMMKPSMEYDLVFNDYKSVELVKSDNGSGYTRRAIYHRNNKRAFQFLSKDTINYYFEMNLAEMMAEIEISSEELAELDKMLKLKKYEDLGTKIFGFKCDEVTMMQPDDFSKIYTIGYTTEAIPHLGEAMGPMSKFFKGAAIKTIMFVNGLKITFGAKEYQENNLLEKYLDFNPENYEKITLEEFEKMRKH